VVGASTVINGTTITANNTYNATVNLQGQNFGPYMVPDSIQNLIINASGAVFSEATGFYVVPCGNIDSVADVVLDVYNSGSGQTTKIALTGRDYVAYAEWQKECVLGGNGYQVPEYDTNPSTWTTVFLTKSYAINHCYNA